MNIAVSGGMGSGKSQVSKQLSKILGVNLVNVDHICRDLLQPSCEGLDALQKVVPAVCFSPDGTLDRPVLREAIFADELLRKQVDGIIHPLVRKETLRFCKESEINSISLVFEIPLLFEKGWQSDFDCTLLVYASPEICVKRIMQRDLVSKSAALLSIAAQMPIQEKVMLADFLVDNSGSFAETLEQLEYLDENDSFVRKKKLVMKNT
jgi:dephospho-CoA kinase